MPQIRINVLRMRLNVWTHIDGKSDWIESSGRLRK